MSYESGSRFGSTNSNGNSNYFNSQYSQNSIPPNQERSFPSSNPIQSNNYDQPLQNNQQQMNPNQPGTQAPTAPLSAHLTAFGQINQNNSPPELLLTYLKPQEKAQLKAQNQQTYNMSPNSKVYLFYPRHLESLMVKYSSEFPPQLKQEMRKQLSEYRSASLRYGNMFFAGVGYWLMLRSKKWFQLTGNPVQRLTFTFLSVSYMMDMNYAQNEYLTKQIFANNKYFEETIEKFNQTPQFGGKASLLTRQEL